MEVGGQAASSMGQLHRRLGTVLRLKVEKHLTNPKIALQAIHNVKVKNTEVENAQFGDSSEAARSSYLVHNKYCISAGTLLGTLAPVML